jgi:hypothetical protein
MDATSNVRAEIRLRMKRATLDVMARVAVRLVLAALLALISAQAAAPVIFEQPRPATASWHRMARRTVPAARPVRAAAAVRVAVPDYSFSASWPVFNFGLFVRPPPFLLT